MVTQGTVFQCTSCHTEVEIVTAAEQFGGPLVCCEIEMKQAENDVFAALYEREAYDVADFEWN